MEINNPKISSAVVLDTRRRLQNGLFPLKLRITHHRSQKYFRLKYDFSEEEYANIIAPRPKGLFKEISLELHEIEKRAIGIINDLDFFTFEHFEDKFFNKTTKTNNVLVAYENYIEKLKRNEQFATAESYSSSYKSLKDFSNRLILRFEEITVSFLNEYERWMLRNGKSFTTIGIYCRNLRRLINEAIENDVIQRKHYPFGKNKYQIPTGRNIKKALSLDELEKIYNYPAKRKSATERARDLWFFSYLCNGMNIADMAQLKFRNIIGDKIVFHRKKTIHSSRNNMKPIVVMLSDEALEIIRKWGNKPNNDTDFVFKILKPGLTPERERAIIKQTTRNINKYMERIAKELQIEKKITTYYARHSFSTVLKNSGASIEFISESLGHSDIKTTEHYLDSFDDETKRKFVSSLTAFNKKQ